MKVAVLFDGAGLARLGLEEAGLTCTGFELDPNKHLLSKYVGSGNCILADATKVDLTGFDAVWSSPPCQLRSSARTQGPPVSPFSQDYLEWSLKLPHHTLWVENIMSQKSNENFWGLKWNAAQFLKNPLQNRNRIIGGSYRIPIVFREYKKWYSEFELCPTITATEWKGCASDKRRASRFYGRMLKIEDCAYRQGFDIPKEWYDLLKAKVIHKREIYEAIGNGVPPYMSKAFGVMYT
jgi:site-specific DNA-cytosine methylase